MAMEMELEMMATHAHHNENELNSRRKVPSLLPVRLNTLREIRKLRRRDNITLKTTKSKSYSNPRTIPTFEGRCEVLQLFLEIIIKEEETQVNPSGITWSHFGADIDLRYDL